ncbi:unnamed protein product [Closterium sp. NIES-54]
MMDKMKLLSHHEHHQWSAWRSRPCITNMVVSVTANSYGSVAPITHLLHSAAYQTIHAGDGISVLISKERLWPVSLGGYGRTDPLLKQALYPNGLVVGILTWHQSGLGFESRCMHMLAVAAVPSLLAWGVFLLVPNSFASSFLPVSSHGRAAGAGGTTATTGSGGTCPGGAGAAGPGGTAEAAGDGPTGGSAGASGGTGAAGSAGPAAAGATGVGAAGGVGTGGSADAGPSEGTGAGTAGAAGSGGAPRPRPYFVPLLEQVLGLPPSPRPAPPFECPQPVQSQSLLQPVSPLPAPSPCTGPTGGLAERRAPASRPASPARPACTSRRTSRPRPPVVPGTHQMALRPSTAPLRVPLPSPPASSLPAFPDPESDSLRAASPTVARFLATFLFSVKQKQSHACQKSSNTLFNNSIKRMPETRHMHLH